MTALLDVSDVTLRYKTSSAVVTATEPVFGYMTDALGMKVLNYDFQVAIMNDAPIQPRHPMSRNRAATSAALSKTLFIDSFCSGKRIASPLSF